MMVVREMDLIFRGSKVVKRPQRGRLKTAKSMAILSAIMRTAE